MVAKQNDFPYRNVGEEILAVCKRTLMEATMLSPMGVIAFGFEGGGLRNRETTTTNLEKRIAVDLQSGVLRNDADPLEVALEGVKLFNEEYPRVPLLLIGDQWRISRYLSRHYYLNRVCEIRHAFGSVAMSLPPKEALLRLRGTSMHAMVEALRNDEAQVGLSAGNARELILHSIELGKVNRDPRIALAALYPVKKEGQPLVLLDVGARSITPTAGLLVCDALKGVAFFKSRYGKDHPKVALLNIVGEERKGSVEVKQAALALQHLADETKLFKYVGFIEADDMPNGRADVVVTDGTTGNHVIKASKGTASYVSWVIEGMAEENFVARLCAAILFKVSARRRAQLLNPNMHNKAVILGLQEPVITISEDSGSEGFRAGLVLAMSTAQGNLARVTSEHLNALPEKFKFKPLS